MKILIVDDEAIVRVGIKSIIDWNKYGYEIVGEASNGKVALEIIKDKDVDIIITDIKMPVMDGLELIKEGKKINSELKFLVLSSYGDLALVKEAMKFGAEDYILKLGMEQESLIEVIDKIKLSISTKKEEIDKETQFINQLKKNIPLIRSKFLKECIHNSNIDKKEFYSSIEMLNINLNIDYIYCMVIKIQELYRFENMNDEQVDFLNNSLINLCEEIIVEEFNGYCFENKTGLFCILLSFKEDSKNKNFSVIENTAFLLAEMLKQYLNITAIIGVSDINSGITGFKAAYNQAKKALEYRFFYHSGNVILFNESEVSSLTYDKYSVSCYRKKIHNALAYHKKEELEEVFNQIVKDVVTLHLGREIVCNVTIQIFNIVCEFLEKYQLEARTVLSKSYKTYHEMLLIDSLVEVKQWINELQEDLIAFIKNEANNDYPRIIAVSKKYMEDNFNIEISLKEVADKVGLNPSYFSTLFKQYTGMSYVEYITQLRINKAKELLTNCNCKVYEISDMVGYENSYYFNRIFKKITGMTPIEYKNLKKVH